MVDNVRNDGRVFVRRVIAWSETENMGENRLCVFSSFKWKQVDCS